MSVLLKYDRELKKLVATFYITFSLLILIFEITRKKDFWFDFLSVFNIYFLIYYLFPAIMISGGFFGYVSRWSLVYPGDTFDNSLKVVISILFSYSLVVLSYLLTNTNSGKKIVKYNKKNILEDNDILYNILTSKKVIYAMIGIGLVSLIFYSTLFGGIVDLITQTNSIRNSEVNSENSSLEFIRRFIPAFMIAGYLIFIKFLKTKKNKYIFISILVALPWFLVNAGRAAILNFIIVLILSYLLHERKKLSLVATIVVGIMCFLGINYLRPFFSSLAYLDQGFGAFIDAFLQTSTSGRYSVDGFVSILTILANSFAHKFNSTEVAIYYVDAGIHQMNYFLELFIAMISVIPSDFLFFEKPDSIIYYNTLYMTGLYESQIPPGGIALSYYSFSWAGIVVFSIVFGMIGRKLNDFFKKFNMMEVIYIVVMFLWISIYIDGEFRQTLQRNFVLILLLIFMMISYKLIKTQRVKKDINKTKGYKPND